MKTHARVVVIGGGVLGCSIAYHLTKAGCADVLLLERAELTSGSTWHAAANIHAMHGNASLARLQDYTIKIYDRLEEETGQSVGLHRCGGLYLATSQERFDELKIQRARARYLGQEFEIVGPEEIRKLNPLVKMDRVLGGMWGASDGHVDPSGVTQAFAKGARMGGATIERECPVTALTQRSDGGWDVATPKGNVVAETVINVAGLWAREVAALAGYHLPLMPMEHQYVVTENVPEIEALGKEMPLTRDQDGEFYMRQEGKGLLLGCYERHGVHWAIDGTPLDFGMQLFPDAIERMEKNMEAAMTIIPAFGNAGLKRVVNGPMIWSPDAAALVGPIPGLKNHFCAAGMIPGFSQSAGVGWALAAWVLEGEPPLDMMPLDVSRFGDWAGQGYVLARTAENYGKRFAISYPGEERLAGRPLKTSPVYDLMKDKGAVMGASYGFERPLWFAGKGEEPRDILTFRRPNWFGAVKRECKGLREGVGMIEISGFSKFEVEGPKAEAFLDQVLACRLPQKIGRTVLAPMLNRKGGIIGDFTVTRLGDQLFYIVGAGAAERFHMRWFADHMPASGVAIRPVTLQRAGFAIAGPNARTLLGRLTRADLSNAAFPFLSTREIEVAMTPVRAMRIAFTGDLGYELHVPAEYQRALYHGLMEAGADLGLTLAGSRALDSLRLEKSYGRWGTEYTADTTPMEAGLDRFVKLDKGSFIGKQALERAGNEGPRYKLATITVDADKADCWGSEPVLQDGKVVGVVSSGGYGHHVDRSIAMVYVNPDLADDAGGLEVEILGEMRKARLEPQALFDPGNERLRG
ncbi:MAG: FAD-dependent oxidoreductase [Proteobacteria bacterium]|nr:FAD-dependent oxidoreductase [Pseudomonadota bacterium]